MAFDKAKAVNAAEKYLAQGKISAAVQEYRRIVDAEPDDFTALNTLGDLYARLDKRGEAVQCFVRVADHYREQGFALKAIAIYKKVARLKPEELSVASKLAALYEQQGLLVEARAQYLHIADTCMRAKQTRDALEALRRTADLDPQNAEIRLRLAEGFMREGMEDEAASAYAEAGSRQHARSDYSGALRSFIMAHDLRRHDHQILQGLVDAHLALGATEEAATVLEEAAAETPDDLELHAMLARVYLDAEDAPAADRAAVKLIDADQSNYPVLFEVAQLYLQQGDAHAAVRTLTRAVEPALAKRQEKQLLEVLNGALARDPENTEALRLLLRIYTWQRDDDRMRIALERLAEAAQAQELYDEERNALEHLIRLVPFDQTYAERLAALNEMLGTDGQSAAAPQAEPLPSEPVNAAPEPPPPVAPPVVEAPPLASSPVVDEAPAFGEIFETNSVAQEAFTVPPPSAPAAPPAPPTEFEWHTLAAPVEAAHADPNASFADLNEEFADHREPPPAVDFAVPLTAESMDADEEHEVNVTNPLGEAAILSGHSAAPDVLSDSARVQALLAHELESVDYYLAQGYNDIARDTLDLLERQYGRAPEIDARRQQLQAIAAPPPPPSAQPTAPNSAPPQGPTAAPSALATTSASSRPSAPALDPGLAEVFDEFRSSIEEESETDDAADFETHYNTGLAYMEMGMTDLAVEEFQTAVSSVAPQDGTARYLQCCNLLGHCFMQQGMWRAAAIWFRKGLAVPGHTEEEYQALRYELGTAYEQMGDLDRALDTFQEVYGIDVSYRGVADKLKELQMQKVERSEVGG